MRGVVGFDDIVAVRCGRMRYAPTSSLPALSLPCDVGEYVQQFHPLTSFLAACQLRRIKSSAAGVCSARLSQPHSAEMRWS